MTLDEIRNYCLSLPGTTEDVKWGHDLVFSIGEKMFAVTSLESEYQSLSFKVREEEYDELSSREHFIPAPYLARAKWVYLNDSSTVKPNEIYDRLRTSYILVREKLAKKSQLQLPPLD